MSKLLLALAVLITLSALLTVPAQSQDDPPIWSTRSAESTWVAEEIFEVDATEWRTALDALTAAGLVTATWESPTRATITFILSEGQP